MFSGINLAAKFQALKDWLEATFGTLFGYGDDMVRGFFDLEGTLESYLKQIRDMIGYNAGGITLRQYLNRLLTNGAVTDTVNLNSLLERLKAMHTYDGADPDGTITELRDLLLGFRQQVIGPTSPTIAELISTGTNTTAAVNTNLILLLGKLDTLLEEVSTIRLLAFFPAEGPNIMQLSANVADCVCELVELLTPTEPPYEPPSLVGHPCADGSELAMVIRPEDWTYYNETGWFGVPGWISPAYAGMYVVNTFPAAGGGDPAAFTVLTYNEDDPEFHREWAATTDDPTLVISQMTMRTFYTFPDTTPPGIAPAGIVSICDNLSANSGGCDPFIMPGVEASYDYVAFELDGTGFTMPPTQNILIYKPAPA